MILMVEDKEAQDRILELCGKSAFGCKIQAAAISYGFDKKFSCYWMDEKDSAAFCLIDDTMIVSGTVINPSEVNTFVRAVGAKRIICAVRNAEVLDLPKNESGEVLKKTLDGEAQEIKPEMVNIREVFFMLEEHEMADDFESFYLDLSHRIRHGVAFVEMIFKNDELAGCAVVSAITPVSAIISAVAVNEEYRRQGIGGELIKKAEEKLSGRTVYVFKEKEKNTEFYKSLGYSKADTWVSAEI